MRGDDGSPDAKRRVDGQLEVLDRPSQLLPLQMEVACDQSFAADVHFPKLCKHLRMRRTPASRAARPNAAAPSRSPDSSTTTSTCAAAARAQRELCPRAARAAHAGRRRRLHAAGRGRGGARLHRLDGGGPERPRGAGREGQPPLGRDHLAHHQPGARRRHPRHAPGGRRFRRTRFTASSSSVHTIARAGAPDAPSPRRSTSENTITSAGAAPAASRDSAAPTTAMSVDAARERSCSCSAGERATMKTRITITCGARAPRP